MGEEAEEEEEEEEEEEAESHLGEWRVKVRSKAFRVNGESGGRVV